jgi:DNA-binding MarR family transcriptional regulator
MIAEYIRHGAAERRPHPPDRRRTLALLTPAGRRVAAEAAR